MYRNTEIIYRDQVTPLTINNNNINTKDPNGGAIDDWYEEQVYPSLSINAASQTSKAKSLLLAGAREILRQRARAKKRLSQVKSQRPIAIGLQKQIEIL